MLILIIILIVIIAIINHEFIESELLTGTCFVIFIMCLIGITITFSSIGENKVINDKINMYQKENKQIETQIDTLVKEYMKFEGNTIKDFKSESYITLITMYPDLKSSELVKEQIKIYTKNNNKIKELKENKLNYKLAKWWLYFGK